MHAEWSSTRIFWAKQAKNLTDLITKISKLFNRKHQSWNRYRKKEDHKTSHNQTTNQIKELKRRFEEKLAEDVKDNPKTFWCYANQNVAPDTQSRISCIVVNQLLILNCKLKFSTNNSHPFFPPILVLFIPHFFYMTYHIRWY